MVDIEALLKDVQSSQETHSKPLPRASDHVNRTTSSAKRSKRNANEEPFAIFEDETAAADAANDRDEVQPSPQEQSRERNLDLPVENMNTGELVPGSQEGVVNLTPRRSRFRLGSISLGRTFLPLFG